MLEVCGPQEAHHGLGWAAGEHIIVFYAYDGRIGVRKPIRVQTTLTAVVSMPGEGTQTGKTQGTLHVLALEVEGEYPTGGTGTTTTMQLLWDAHAIEATV